MRITVYSDKDYHRDHRHAASTQDSDSPPFRIAASVGADPDGVREALASARFRQLVLDEHHEAAGRGIRSVPTVLIPGRPAVVGAVPYPDLREAVAAGCSGESRGGTSEGS
jgi:predicted DsbA family dithiol-disulfide isomerase